MSIGLAVRGVPRLGVVLDPYRDELWVAAAGEGAYLNGRRLGVVAAAPSAWAVACAGGARARRGAPAARAHGARAVGSHRYQEYEVDVIRDKRF